MDILFDLRASHDPSPVAQTATDPVTDVSAVVTHNGHL